MNVKPRLIGQKTVLIAILGALLASGCAKTSMPTVASQSGILQDKRTVGNNENVDNNKVGPQWFWEGKWWESSGAVQSAVWGIIDRQPSIQSNAARINKMLAAPDYYAQLSAGTFNRNAARQQWNPARNELTVSVPFANEGSALLGNVLYVIRPTFFYVGPHTGDLIGANYAHVQFAGPEVRTTLINLLDGGSVESVVTNANTQQVVSTSYNTYLSDAGIMNLLTPPAVGAQSIIVSPAPGCPVYDADRISTSSIIVTPCNPKYL